MPRSAAWPGKGAAPTAWPATRGRANCGCIRREKNYFRSHRQRLNHQALSRRGWPIGSGAVESACAQRQRRFKRLGQLWTDEGLRRLNALNETRDLNHGIPTPCHCSPATFHRHPLSPPRRRHLLPPPRPRFQDQTHRPPALSRLLIHSNFDRTHNSNFENYTTLLEISVAFRAGLRQNSLSSSGRSVVWLARLFRVQEVVSSNLTAPTIFSQAPE